MRTTLRSILYAYINTKNNMQAAS